MYYVAIIDHGTLSGPYASFADADTVVQSTASAIAFVADAAGNPHPDLDPALAAEIAADLDADFTWTRI